MYVFIRKPPGSLDHRVIGSLVMMPTPLSVIAPRRSNDAPTSYFSGWTKQNTLKSHWNLTRLFTNLLRSRGNGGSPISNHPNFHGMSANKITIQLLGHPLWNPLNEPPSTSKHHWVNTGAASAQPSRWASLKQSFAWNSPSLESWDLGMVSPVKRCYQ